jgi:hypothetical protein
MLFERLIESSELLSHVFFHVGNDASLRYTSKMYSNRLWLDGGNLHMPLGDILT